MQPGRLIAPRKAPALACLPLLTLASAVIGGCATVSGTLPAFGPLQTGRQASADVFFAGTAKVDITPPPGFPMGGHGFAGQISRGHWLRLYSRAVYFEDYKGQTLVLVSADLWSIPGGLSDRVAQLVGEANLKCNVHRDALIVAATHTHQSPGNFSTSSGYNALASADIGFDRALFDFLARRIADSVASACTNKERAHVVQTSARVPLLFRNRSVTAFKRNPEHRSILDKNADLPVGHSLPEYPDPAAYRAIDPTVRVWRIASAEDDHTIAIAAFAAVHPTTIDHSAGVYSSDLFGVAATLVEQRLRSSSVGHPKSSSPPTVVAIFNGAEGDVSANWAYQNRRDTLELGSRLADAIHEVQHGGVRIEGPINLRAKTFHLANACYFRPDGREACTDSKPMFGVATLAGAEDGRTTLYSPWKDGAKREGVVAEDASNPRQAPKWPGLDHPSVLPPLLSPTHWLGAVLSVPQDVSLGVYRVGEIALVTLPGEFTTMMGQRIAETVQGSIRPAVGDVIIIGLANEYVSYFTTPEEYQAQHYEGASTLYGSASGSVILEQLRGLAMELDSRPPVASSPRRFAYSVGVTRSFQLSVNDRPVTFPRAVAINLSDGSPMTSELPTHCWREPYTDLRRPSGDQVIPSVRIEHQDVVGTWRVLTRKEVEEDDRGLNFVTIAKRVTVNTVEWCSGWLGASNQDVSGVLRFCVRTAQDHDGGCSQAFMPRP